MGQRLLEWMYKDAIFLESDIDNNIGFVYIITNEVTGRKYIGKKTFWFTKTKQVNKKKKRYKVPSDWPDYYGSNETLLEDVKTLGKENFTRTILFLCKTKGECSYLEAKEQFNRNVIESDDYYNIWIMVKVRASHIKQLIENTKNASDLQKD